ncbi:MAG: UDP-N-acetylmuramate dehydrogenase [Candidatus Ratteibacteria bacterium]|nr:UDP-N-acetylmuramate dehydrogenase [Candidatus Ratteibacteria bacterium]
MDDIKKILAKKCSSFRENFPLSLITSFRTGGPARFFISPLDIKEVKTIVALCLEHNVPFLVIGSGTNILISDKGFDGVVISTKDINRITVDGDDIYCQPGVLLSTILKECIRNSLKGLEFLSGIPGTAGGAAISNAGLKEEWLSDRILRVDVFSLSDIEEKALTREEIHFDYRKSGLEGYFITGILLHLNKGKQEDIKGVIATYMKKRIETQPLNYPSAGSIFKNPSGLFAGNLIERCGLKGYSIGDACISEKHANFIINKGKATSEEIYKLISIVKEQVKIQYNIELETEIKLIGNFGE